MRYNSNTVNIFASFAVFALLFAPATSFAYQAAPLANTKAPTYVTEKSARLNGAVNPNEMPDTYVWFEWGIAGRDQFYQTPHRNFSGGNQPYDTYEDIYGLAPNVQYFYRQVAENGRGKDIGLTTYFTAKPITVTVDPLVIVNTNNATAITDSGALLHGYIAPHESQGVQYWFQWGKTNKLENETPHSGWGSDSGSTQATLSGLTSGTVYYFRMVGQNGLGLVYGETRVFATTGLPPPPPEAPRDQSVSGAQASDGVTRTVTTSGATAASGGSAQSGTGIFGIKTQYGAPSLVFNPSAGSIFGGNKTAGTASAANSNVNANTNVAALGATNPVGSFWNTLTGKKVVAVQLEKIGPSKVPEHTPIEYRITYVYQATSPATNAKLRIILPTSVVYIGDNTNNELLLEDAAGPERTYDLPIGRLEKGSTRTISILGITTSDAKGTFPDARARLEYTDSVGASNVVASVSGAAESSGASSGGSSSFSLIPTSFFGWLLYVLVITGLIFGVRKAKAYYQKRLEQIALEEEASRRENEAPVSFARENIPAT